MNIIKKLLSILSLEQKRRVLPLLLLMFFGMILETFSIGLVVPLVSIISDSNSIEKYEFLQPILVIFNSFGFDFVVASMFILLFVFIFKTLFLTYLYWKQSKFIYDSQADISKRLFEQYLLLPYSFHISNNSAQLIRNVVTETTQLANGAINTGMTLIIEVLVMLGIIVLLLIIEPIGALVVGLSLGLVGGIFYFASRNYILMLGSKRHQHEGYRLQHIQQGLNGIKDIKTTGNENYFINRYSFHNTHFANAAQKQYFIQNVPRIALELIAILSLISLVLFMISQGRGFHQIVPILAMFGAAAFRLMPSLNRILGNWQTFQYTTPVINTLYKEFHERTKQPLVANSKKEKLTFNHLIVLENISYAYSQKSSLVLDNINLKIKHGTSIGLIGSSGAGKSTLVDIILGLLTPASGRILIDGVSLEGNLSKWQNNIGYVPQSIYITDDSIKNNIAFGVEETMIDEQKINKAIELAQLKEYVGSLEEGINTNLGEMGVRLSGGQKQRIGIARALYNNPDVLIFDEATSALDNETEKEFMKAVDFLHGKKTLIIIAHRLTTVSNCDYIYKLEKGKIISTRIPVEILNV